MSFPFNNRNYFGLSLPFPFSSLSEAYSIWFYSFNYFSHFCHVCYFLFLLSSDAPCHIFYNLESFLCLCVWELVRERKERENETPTLWFQLSKYPQSTKAGSGAWYWVQVSLVWAWLLGPSLAASPGVCWKEATIHRSRTRTRIFVWSMQTSQPVFDQIAFYI